ncbi:MAG: HAMP domain-containing histidine kinase [Candidatus Eremiobacteraeota bacterium]|nr:HAMP domain-containing histidine kinase [Candidatus Eremiobacteraeota bacterium]
MLRRVVLGFALSACAVVAGGVVAWRYHIGAVAAQLDAQAQTAQSLLATEHGRSDPQSIVYAVARNDINVIFHDRSTGVRYAWREGSLEIPLPERAGPPPGEGPPGEPLPGAPPPREGPRYLRIIADLAHIRPRHLEAGSIELTLVPSMQSLVHWLVLDVVVCIAFVIGLAVAAWLIGAALLQAERRPLLRTTLALEALAAGDFTPQTVVAGEMAEIARLARAYNAAAETVARSIEERRAAAAEFQRFLADAGHELRTPLTIVGGYVDILRRSLKPGDVTTQRIVAGMTAETARMRGLVEKMLLLSRLEAPVAAPRVVSVGEVSEDVAETMRAAFPQCEIALACDASARITVDEDDLYEAERNLVENALRYAPGSPVEISASVENGRVLVAVSDDGPGIAPEERALVFERFYRGKERGDAEGSGLGLAIVKRVVQRWGGTIDIDDRARGTRFVMSFPLARGEAT